MVRIESIKSTRLIFGMVVKKWLITATEITATTNSNVKVTMTLTNLGKVVNSIVLTKKQNLLVNAPEMRSTLISILLFEEIDTNKTRTKINQNAENLMITSNLT